MPSTRQQFENNFAARLGAKKAFAFWKGRVGLYAILKALGVGVGDEVMVAGYTCVAVVRPIKYLGARPVYVDIEPDTYNLDVAKIARAVTNKTRVLIAQHTFGYPVDMDAVMALATQHNIEVVEDACLALGSRYKGQLVGTWAKAAYWSMQWNKTFTTGFGGMVTTSDELLAIKLERLIKDEAITPSLRETWMLAGMRAIHQLSATPKNINRVQTVYRWLSRNNLVSVNPPGPAQVKYSPRFFKHMGAGQAKAGLQKLDQLEANIAHRRKISALYTRLLASRGWRIPPLSGSADPIFVRYPVRVRNKIEAIRLAQQRHLEIGTWFDSPLHQCTESLNFYDYVPGTCPIAERAANEVVNLPTHCRVTEADARAAVDLVCAIGPVDGCST